MSLATPPNPTSSTKRAALAIPNKDELESMKVVDLKQLVKDSGLNERGLLSKLKRKQDLVNFLIESSNNLSIASNQTLADAATIQNQVVIQKSKPAPADSSVNNSDKPPPLPPKRKKGPLSMPQKGKFEAAIEQAQKQAAKAKASGDEPSTDERSEKKAFWDKMEAFWEEIHEQYPPLRYLQAGNLTTWGALDIRQQYHPMLLAGILQKANDGIPEDNDDEASADEASTEPETIRYKPSLSGDMDLIFVGTASCTPSMTRGVSCTALRVMSSGFSASVKSVKNNDLTRNNRPLGTWIFDCGESTQLQIQKTNAIKASKINKIFLTHAHGDHSFGLPGLLCFMGQDTAGGSQQGSNGENIRKTKDSKEPVDIYGPEGLRIWLRTAIRYSVSRIVPRYRVHELKDVAMAPEWGYSAKWEKYYFNKKVFKEMQEEDPTLLSSPSYYKWGDANRRRKDALINYRRQGQVSDWLSLCDEGAPGIEPSELYGEVPGGRDIYPQYDHPLASDGAPVWEVEDSDGIKVYAAPMSHGVPCVGYVVHESDRPGRLRDDLVKPICERNIPALKEAGFKHPMKALAVIKDLPPDGSFTFPDGTVVTQKEAVEPPRPGRKVVICGDTSSARSMTKLAENADVLVHESTNAFLPEFDHKISSFRSVNMDAISHGHSTPQIAGSFAKHVNAKRLIINHFSARYLGDQSLDSISTMTKIEQQAIRASGLNRTHVAAAWDFMVFPVPKIDQKTGEPDESDEENEK